VEPAAITGNTVAALKGIYGALLGEDARPMLGQDRQKIEGKLPMLGIFVAHQPGEAVKAQPFRLHLIEEMRQLGGQGRCLFEGEIAAMLANHLPSEGQPAAHSGYGRRHIPCARRRQILGGCDGQRFLVDIAEGHHVRQQKRRASALAQERFPERA